MVPGPDTITKLVLTIVLIPILLLVIGVFVQLSGPIYENVVSGQLMTDLGWGVPQTVLLLFAAIALIIIPVVVLIWWVVSPIRDDVRQEQTRGRF